MKKMNNKKTGFSLIELLLVLGIIAALAITAFMVFPKVSSKNTIQTEVANINMILAGANAMYAGVSTYDGISNEVLINANVVPEKMISGSDEDKVLLNGYKGTVEIKSSKDFLGKLEITYKGVPKSDCVGLITTLIPNFSVIKTNGVTIKHENGTYNIKNATEVCNIKESADMIFVS